MADQRNGNKRQIKRPTSQRRHYKQNNSALKKLKSATATTIIAAGLLMAGTQLDIIPDDVPIAVLDFMESVSNPDIEYTRELKVYGIRDSRESDFTLYDSMGREISVRFDDLDDVHAITGTGWKKKEGNIPVILVNDNGNTQEGYTNRSNLSFFSEGKINLDDRFSNDIYMVSAKSGAYLRSASKIDREDDEAILLPPETCVLVGSEDIYANDNVYNWKLVVYFDGDELRTGYMANEYLCNTNIKNAKGIHMKVDSPNGLKFRKRPEISEENIISRLGNGEEVVVIPNVSSKSDGEHDWFYVLALNSEGEAQLGYCAATEYNTDGTVANYLVPVDQNRDQEEQETTNEENQYEDNRILIKKVNTDNESGVDLKVREKPSTKSKIIATLENGTLISTTEAEYNSAINGKEKNKHKWLKINLPSGESGYIAVEYLVDRDESDIDITTVTTRIGDRTITNGVLGIDVSTISPGKLGQLLSTSRRYEDSQFSSGVVEGKPGFAIMKMGASGWGTKGPFTIIPKRSKSQEKQNFTDVRARIETCEKYGIPYGLYYYSQAVTQEEADQEIEFIVNFYKKLGKMPGNVLPFYLDVEQGGNGDNTHGRNKVLTNRTDYTETINYILNSLRERFSKEGIDIPVGIYTDNNGIRNLFDPDLLDEPNKKNMWLVGINDRHAELLKEGSEELLNSVETFQVVQDVFSVGGDAVDINIMTKEHFIENYVQMEKNKSNGEFNEQESRSSAKYWWNQWFGTPDYNTIENNYDTEEYNR